MIYLLLDKEVNEEFTKIMFDDVNSFKNNPPIFSPHGKLFNFPRVGDILLATPRC